MDVETMSGLDTSTLLITPEILSLIAEIDEFKGAWRAIGRIAPARLSSLRRVATIESIGSSTRIEGARLSDRDVDKLLSNLQLGSLATSDEQEVAGYAGVMKTIFRAYDAIPVTENHVRQFHRDLLAHSTKDERHRGEWKTLDNHVEAFDEDGRSLGVVFATAAPFETPRLMAELVAWLKERDESRDLHPLLVVGIFVVVFLAIHPFQDGNGRLSRVLTTLLLLRAGYAYVPYSSLESVIEQSKEAYYLSLRRTQGTIRTNAPDWNPWIEFFLRALKQHKQRLERKMECERVVLGDLPELSVAILELASEHGRVTVQEAARLTGASRNTVKDHLKLLTEQGHLRLRGAGRGAWYGLS
ncbi:Fic family protein [Brucella intermedia]|uniref:Fic family protein n=1 Tax=Brucella intermedia TaxID=94625 RepID=UPI00224B47F8|nr:Fic family protein [Brucella intermedia]